MMVFLEKKYAIFLWSWAYLAFSTKFKITFGKITFLLCLWFSSQYSTQVNRGQKERPKKWNNSITSRFLAFFDKGEVSWNYVLKIEFKHNFYISILLPDNPYQKISGLTECYCRKQILEWNHSKIVEVHLLCTTDSPA